MKRFRNDAARPRVNSVSPAASKLGSNTDAPARVPPHASSDQSTRKSFAKRSPTGSGNGST